MRTTGIAVAAAAVVMALSVDAGAIVNGTPDADHPAVGAIQPVPPFCGAAPSDAVCTGTLVAPRVVLTAAHCVGDARAAQLLAVTFARDVTSATEGQRLRVVDVEIDPAWTDGDAANDAALLLLDGDAPVMPASLALDASATAGAALTIVGYGADASGHLGRRLAGAALVGTRTDGDFDLVASPAMTCGGDSGGPAFVSGASGERIVGITAFGDAACTTGTDVRVDAVASFLSSAMAALATPATSRPPIDPSLDACASTCASSAECPIGMACTARGDGTSGCAISGLTAGRFGGSCAAAEGDVPCVQAGSACLLWMPCASAVASSAPARTTVTGGCAITRGVGRSGDGVLLSALVLAVSVARLRARRRPPGH